MVKWISGMLVLVLAGVGYFAFRGNDGGERVIEGPGARGGPSSERPAPVGLEAGDPGADPRGARTAGAPTLDPAPEGAAIDTGASTPAGSAPDLVRVEVVAAETGKPVPAAEVFWLDRTTVAEQRLALAARDPRAIDTLVITSGRRFVADQQGSLQVPRTTNGALFGRAERLRGRTEWFGEPGEVIELRLDPERELLALVVGPDETLLASIPITVGFERDGKLVHIVDRSTGAGGAPARFANLSRVLAAGPSYFVTIAIPGAMQERVPIDVDRIPAETIRLRMPPTGSIQVVVVEADGSSFSGTAQVSIGRFSGAHGEDRGGFYTEAREALRGGRATFAHVALGARLAFRVDGPPVRPPLDAEHPGPTRPGESTEIRLVWKDRYPLLIGRAVDERGDLQVARRGISRVLVDGTQVDGTSLITDNDGRFEIALRNVWIPGTERRLGMTLFQTGALPKCEASIDIAHEVANEDIDLGDVLFEAAPLLAAGRVRTLDGQPVGGALVRVQWRRAGGDGDAIWTTGRDVGVATDAKGRFAIYGALEPSAMRVSCVKRGYKRVESAVIEPGSASVELAIEPGVDVPTAPQAPRSGG